MPFGLMNPVHAVFSLNGRMRRRDFWAYAGLFWLFYIPFVAVFALILRSYWPLTVGRSMGLSLLFTLPALIWVSIALMAKRLHDRNMRAWDMITVLKPVIGWIWGFSEIGLADGTQGPNFFGPSPKGINGIEDVF